MNQQRVGIDFFEKRPIINNITPKKLPTVLFTARKCPVCHKLARVLVRPPFTELQSEICVDHCDGLRKFPRSYVSFEGSNIEDGEVVVELIRGIDGKDGAPGRDGKDAVPPTRQELIDVVKQVLREQGFWRRLFGRIK